MAAFTSIARSELETFVAARDLRLVAFGAIPEGSVNSNFWVTAAGPLGLERRWFLRVFEEQGPEGARAEAAMLAALEKAGVPTPAPVAARNGEAIGVVAGKPAALFPWRAGHMRCQASVTAADLHQLGAALARVHRAPLAISGASVASERGPGRFRVQDLLVRLERVRGAADGELARLAGPLQSALEENASRRAKALPDGLVHGDLFRDNVLWNDDGSLSALLDFESAFTGPLVYDLAVCGLSWCYGDAFDVALLRALVDGYQRERPLTDEERQALYEETCFGALRFTVTRITDYAMRADAGPRVMKDYRRFLGRYEALTAWGGERFMAAVFNAS